MEEVNYYEILEIKKNATLEQIKKAYKKLALLHHPDKGGNPETFRQLSNAYQILSNPDLKRKYDKCQEIDESNLSPPLKAFNDCFCQWLSNYPEIEYLFKDSCQDVLTLLNNNNDNQVVNILIGSLYDHTPTENWKTNNNGDVDGLMDVAMTTCQIVGRINWKNPEQNGNICGDITDAVQTLCNNYQSHPLMPSKNVVNSILKIAIPYFIGEKSPKTPKGGNSHKIPKRKIPHKGEMCETPLAGEIWEIENKVKISIEQLYLGKKYPYKFTISPIDLNLGDDYIISNPEININLPINCLNTLIECETELHISNPTSQVNFIKNIKINIDIITMDHPYFYRVRDYDLLFYIDLPLEILQNQDIISLKYINNKILTIKNPKNSNFRQLYKIDNIALPNKIERKRGNLYLLFNPIIEKNIDTDNENKILTERENTSSIYDLTPVDYNHLLQDNPEEIENIIYDDNEKITKILDQPD